MDHRYLAIRDLTEEDIPHVIDYWYHSPPGFVGDMGVDVSKLPKKTDMESDLKKKVLDNFGLPKSKSNALVITYKGKAIGFHTLNPVVEGDYGIFHAHIWDESFRRQGVAIHSYPRACDIFFYRFDLKKILFKTPVQNKGAIRVKEKLGIRYIGDEVIDFGIIKAGTQAKVFELTRKESQKWNK